MSHKVCRGGHGTFRPPHITPGGGGGGGRRGRGGKLERISRGPLVGGPTPSGESSTATFPVSLRTTVHCNLYVSSGFLVIQYLTESHGASLYTAGVSTQHSSSVGGLRGPDFTGRDGGGGLSRGTTE